MSDIACSENCVSHCTGAVPAWSDAAIIADKFDGSGAAAGGVGASARDGGAVAGGAAGDGVAAGDVAASVRDGGAVAGGVASGGAAGYGVAAGAGSCPGGRRWGGRARRVLAGLRTPLARALGTVVAASMGTMVMSQAYAAHAALPDLNKAWNARIERNDTSVSTMTVVSDKNNALLIWDDFNVAAGSHVYFKAGRDQPVSFLNVVKGPGRTEINGAVVGQNDNINFYLVNPNGIRVGNTGSIEGMKSTYLGTSKISQQTLDRFKNGDAAPQSMQALPETLAMGDVKLYGSVHSASIKVNGDQIVIGEIEKVLPSTTAGDVLELHSGKGRIDIGGKIDSVRLDSRPQQNGAADNKGDLAGSNAPGRNAVTYRQLLEVNGLKAAAKSDLKLNGTHGKGQFVDHSAQKAVYNADGFYNAFTADADGDYWLADDIVLDYEKDSMGALNKDFSGTLDGAFHSITLKGRVKDAGGTAAGADKGRNHGVFARLDGAEISNLKLMSGGLSLDSSLRGQDFNFGLLAGTINNSSLSNVEIDGADLRISSGAPGAGDYMGALAGRLEGNNSMTAVFTSWSDSTASQLSSRNGLVAGHVAGRNDGSVSGFMAGAAGISAAAGAAGGAGAGSLMAVGQGSSDGLASSFSEAWNQSLEQLAASGMSRYDALNSLQSVWATSGSADDGTLKGRNKGFMNAFYIEDFNFMYDGTSHNYADLVNNEGFDINNVLTLVNGTSWDQKDAGQWGFEFTTHKDNQAGGHDYYFSYAQAGNTWDSSAGGSSDLQIRNDRPDSTGGTGTLNINRKPLTITIKDQTIMEGSTADTSIGSNTLGNIADVIASLGTGDTLDDLNLILHVDPLTGKITATHNNGNYDITFVEGALTVVSKPQPEPQPQPDPLPLPQPEPDVRPDPLPLPDSGDITVPVIPETDQGSSLADIDRGAGIETRCQNCHTLDSSAIGSLLWLTDNTVMDLSSLDHSLSIFAALNSGKAPESAGSWLLTADGERLAAASERLAAASDRLTAGSDRLAAASVSSDQAEAESGDIATATAAATAAAPVLLGRTDTDNRTAAAEHSVSTDIYVSTTVPAAQDGIATAVNTAATAQPDAEAAEKGKAIPVLAAALRTVPSGPVTACAAAAGAWVMPS